jgi:tight adherence protein C
MTSLHFHAALACAALAVSALALLMLRRWRAAPGVWPGRLRLPPLLRLVAPIALLIEPLVACVMPATRGARIQRSLEALGLAPLISPAHWEALRIAQGIAWGLLAALASGGSAWLCSLLAAGGYMQGGLWLRRKHQQLQLSIVRDLPGWLDLMTVCVEAGATLTAGLRLIVAQAPEGPLRDYFERVLREVRGGRARAQAFSYIADIYGVESLSTLAGALAHAESSGMSLGQVLRAQAEQRTAERFARAEKLAMQAPVKMLGPLILCIFPCTFIVIGVPIAVRLKEALGT